jgi:hypothetical protein
VVASGPARNGGTSPLSHTPIQPSDGLSCASAEEFIEICLELILATLATGSR